MRRIPVLLYHRIDHESRAEHQPYCVSPEEFEKQIKWLAKNNYHTISLMQLYKYYNSNDPLPENPIVITFDDGFYCNYSRAFRILDQFSYTSTIFLISDKIRTNGIVKEGIESYMSWLEAKEMMKAGFEFGSHTVDHPDLNTLSEVETYTQAKTSKQKIENELGGQIYFFCYPYDRFNNSTKKAVSNAGYLGACGGNGFPFGNKGPYDWYEIGRTEIFFQDSLEQFKFKVKTGYGFPEILKSSLRKAKKIFFRH